MVDNIVTASLNPYSAEAAWLDLRAREEGNTSPTQDRAQPAQRDQAEISPEARRMAEVDPSGEKKDAEGLTEEEQQEVRELKQSDQKVRAHEQAHLAAAGGLARSGANFEYKTGPDGKRYAVGGEVNIDTSPEDDPQATIRKAERIRRAALAPADPSPQDRRVAADAAAMAVKAQQELRQQESGGKPTGTATAGKIDLFA